MIASRQGKSLPEAKATNPARDLMLWREFFRWEDNAHDRYVYHLAQIAAEIRRSNVKDPRFVKVEHFIAKFEYGKKEVPVQEDTVPDYDIIADRTQNSKNYWMLLAGGLSEAPKKRPLPAKVRTATKAAKESQ